MGVHNRQEEYVEDGTSVHEGISIKELESVCLVSLGFPNQEWMLRLCTGHLIA